MDYSDRLQSGIATSGPAERLRVVSEVGETLVGARKPERHAMPLANYQSIGDRIGAGLPGVVGVDRSAVTGKPTCLIRAPDRCY